MTCLNLTCLMLCVKMLHVHMLDSMLNLCGDVFFRFKAIWNNNERDELFQCHCKNHLFIVLHFLNPGHQCFVSLPDTYQQVLLIWGRIKHK